MSLEAPPYRATIDLELWIWSRPRAAAVLEQIVAALENEATNDEGGVSVHHRIMAVHMRTNMDARGNPLEASRAK